MRNNQKKYRICSLALLFTVALFGVGCGNFFYSNSYKEINNTNSQIQTLNNLPGENLESTIRSSSQLPKDTDNWATYKNEEIGLFLKYPDTIFNQPYKTNFFSPNEKSFGLSFDSIINIKEKKEGEIFIPRLFVNIIYDGKYKEKTKSIFNQLKNNLEKSTELIPYRINDQTGFRSIKTNKILLFPLKNNYLLDTLSMDVYKKKTIHEDTQEYDTTFYYNPEYEGLFNLILSTIVISRTD